MNITFLPLDDRPVNLDLPEQLAAIAGERLECPPLRVLKHDVPAARRLPGLAGWLLDRLNRSGAAVLSLDQLCHGGLLESRLPADEGGTSLEEALSRLAQLSELQGARGTASLAAHLVLPRTSLTVASEGDLQMWRDVHAASTEPGVTPESLEPHLIGAGIPSHRAKQVAEVRRRNLQIAQLALEMVRDGTLEKLVLSQEDAAPEGVHRVEQEALGARAAKLGIEDRVHLQAGADEAGAMLAVDAIARHHRLGLGVRPTWGPGGPGAIPPYEDRPLWSSLRDKLHILGARHGFGRQLHLHVLEESDEDHFLAQSGGLVTEGFSGPPPHLAPGAGVADVAFANGGDPAFVEKVLMDRPFLELGAYAGWNTASNSLGTVLAHLLAREVGLSRAGGDDPGLLPHIELLLTRLADDVLYQADLRGRLIHSAQAEGLSIFDLGEGRQPMERLLQSAMSRRFGEIVNDHLKCRPVAGRQIKSVRARFTLPWGRLFEIRAQIQATLD